jgi:hypothetical protein
MKKGCFVGHLTAGRGGSLPCDDPLNSRKRLLSSPLFEENRIVAFGRVSCPRLHEVVSAVGGPGKRVQEPLTTPRHYCPTYPADIAEQTPQVKRLPIGGWAA